MPNILVKGEDQSLSVALVYLIKSLDQSSRLYPPYGAYLLRSLTIHDYCPIKRCQRQVRHPESILNGMPAGKRMFAQAGDIKANPYS